MLETKVFAFFITCSSITSAQSLSVGHTICLFLKNCLLSQTVGCLNWIVCLLSGALKVSLWDYTVFSLFCFSVLWKNCSQSEGNVCTLFHTAWSFILAFKFPWPPQSLYIKAFRPCTQIKVLKVTIHLYLSASLKLSLWVTVSQP